MDIKQEVAQRHSSLIALRRDFHQYPELALEETRTAGIIAGRLRASGLEVRAGVAQTGVVGVVHGGHPGKTLAIRADIDALPIQEENDLPFRSQVPGKMHACGHDGHAAIALTLADILASHRDALQGNVKFLFQPAEERLGGAETMIAEGALKNPEVDTVIGLHLSSQMPAGQVAVGSGALAASSDGFTIRVRGRGGHGAMPHNSIDPILAASQIVVALQSLVTREISPFNPVVLTIGSMHGGTAPNVIPDEVVLEGTFRTYAEADRAHLAARIAELAGQTAAALRASATLEMLHGCPPCISDASMAALVQHAAIESVGAEQVHQARGITASDDMAYFLNAVPGCYFSLGAQPGTESTVPHHSPRFKIDDETSLPVGVEVMLRAALNYLR